MRYILVEWPESQQFIGREGCYYCSPTEDGQLDQAMFVPEKEYYKKIGLPYKFSNTATNGELIDLLSLLYEAQKWLREEKRICVEVDCCAGGYVWELCKAYQGTWFSGGTTIYTHYCEDNENNKLLNDCGKYNTYEDALSEGIKEAVKILKGC